MGLCCAPVYHVNMIDQTNAPDSREQALNAALEAMHFGFRALTARPDERLARLDLSRVHHRILYFVARNPGCSISELLGIMHVSKQYLNRPLRRLIGDGYLTAVQDAGDRRVKRLGLTPAGRNLEEALTGAQRRQLEAVFRRAGVGAEAGWRKVMALLSETDG